MASYALLAWAGYYLVETTYMLWRHGVEKTAHVASLSRTSSGAKGGTTFYYNLVIDGAVRQHGFRASLPVGGDVIVLTIPDQPDTLEVGTRDSTIFELWCTQLGGPITGALVLGMFAYMTATAPKNFRMLFEQRPRILGGRHGR